MKMPRVVEVESTDSRLTFDASAIAKLFHFLDTDAVLESFHLPLGDLAVRFVDLAECRQLHEAFFGDPDPTDVMTFPGEAEDEHAGDLAVCPAYAAEAAPEHGTSFAEELTLYLVHGWLHLVGHDDRSPETVAAMRAAEQTVMKRLREAGKNPEFIWREA